MPCEAFHGAIQERIPYAAIAYVITSHGWRASTRHETPPEFHLVVPTNIVHHLFWALKFVVLINAHANSQEGQTRDRRSETETQSHSDLIATKKRIMLCKRENERAFFLSSEN